MKDKVKNGAMNTLMVVCAIAYVALHIYYAVIAFTQFKIIFALIVTLVPVGGDLLLVGASIYSGNWLPIILGAVEMALWCIASASAKQMDKTSV